MDLLCGWCGKSFVRKRLGPVPKWCSPSCKAMASTARATMDGRAELWRQATRARKLRKSEVSLCVQCGSEYESRHRGRMYCSGACRNRAYHEASRRRESRRLAKQEMDRRRRARKHGDIAATRVDRQSIHERDGWRCGLCSLPIDRDAKAPSPWAPTIDHVIPLSKGGAHTASNVQSAHFICNSVKSNGVFDPTRVALIFPTGTEASDAGSAA